MTGKRRSAGFDKNMDLSDLEATPADSKQVKRVTGLAAQQSGFKSREPRVDPGLRASKKVVRNQIGFRIRPEVEEVLRDIAEENDWNLNIVVEKAILCFRDRLEGKG